jgi:hypothetical protein
MIQVKVYHQRNLDEQDNRNSVFELPMLRLMMPGFHTQPGSNTSSHSCHCQKRCLRNTPFGFLGFILVYTIYDKWAALMTSR